MGHAVALGSGLVGRFVIERLLEAGHEVTVIDLHIPDAFHANPRVHVREGDAMAHVATLEPNQIVVNMLPGRIGDMVRPVLLKAGHQIVDLAFTAEDPHQHEALAVANGSVLLWDVGSLRASPTCLSNKPSRRLAHWTQCPSKWVGTQPKWTMVGRTWRHFLLLM